MFDGEILIDSSESQTQASAIAVPLLVHDCLTENVTHTGKVWHDFTMFSGSLCALPVYTAGIKVAVSNDPTLEPILKHFRGTNSVTFDGKTSTM